MAKTIKTDTSAKAVIEAPEAEVAEEAATPADVVEEPAQEAPAEDPAPAEFQEPEVTEPVIEAPVETPVVSHNSTFINWPTDPWGMTTEFKDALVRLASRVQGASDKKHIVDEVFNIGRAHLEAKFAVDAKVREDAIAAVVAENETKVALEETIAAQGELF